MRDFLERMWARIPDLGPLLAVVAAITLAHILVLILVRRVFSARRLRLQGRPDAERALDYLKDLERWILRAVFLLTVLGLLLGSIWALNFDYREVLNPTWRWLSDKGLRVLLILFLAFLARRGLQFLVGQFSDHLRSRGERSRDEDARLKTLSDVLTGGGSVAIAVVTGFMVLETVLESVGTVLASVGFLGIALGFGAQTLVRDLISGFFILLENQLAVGDGVRINDTWGTVERIGLRTITLRDSEGVLHIVPNGSITRVSNTTRGWSRAVVHAGTDYASDPEKVLSVLAQVGRELRADPRFSKVILGDFEATGPESFDDAVLYRLAGPTVPARQWEVMREIRCRIWKAFAREGIPLKKSPLPAAAGRVE